jgi:hypothetical protein
MGAGGVGEGRGNEWLEQVADNCRIGVDLVPFTAVESDADGGMGRRLATHEGVDDRPQRVGTRCNQRQDTGLRVNRGALGVAARMECHGNPFPVTR